MTTEQVPHKLTTGEEESLARYYDAHKRYEAMRLLLRYEDSKLIMGLALSQRRMLELGCGSLPVLLAVSEPDFTYVGTDLSESGLHLAKRLIPGGQFLVCDATAPGLLPGLFGVIVMKNLLHHLERPEDCLHAVRKLLAPGGTVVVLEPNSTCAAANIAKALLRLVGRELEDSPYGQLKVVQLREVFRATSFEVTEVRHSALLAFPLSGDYGRLKLLPVSVSLWRAIIAVDRVLSDLLLKRHWLARWLGFKIIFHLKPKQ